MMNNFEKMMETMMEKYMEQMMAKTMEKMFSSMMPQEVPAEATAPAKQVVRKLSAEDLDSIGEADEQTTSAKAELGLWEAVNRNGQPYRWYGWADPTTGKRTFPGKQLYHVNDFYLKRDYGAYHPGKTTAYKFKDGGLRAVLTQYKVRNEVAKEDAKEFMAFMKAKEDAQAQRAHDTECYTNWCNHTK